MVDRRRVLADRRRYRCPVSLPTHDRLGRVRRVRRTGRGSRGGGTARQPGVCRARGGGRRRGRWCSVGSTSLPPWRYPLRCYRRRRCHPDGHRGPARLSAGARRGRCARGRERRHRTLVDETVGGRGQPRGGDPALGGRHPGDDHDHHLDHRLDANRRPTGGSDGSQTVDRARDHALHHPERGFLPDRHRADRAPDRRGGLEDVDHRHGRSRAGVQSRRPAGRGSHRGDHHDRVRVEPARRAPDRQRRLDRGPPRPAPRTGRSPRRGHPGRRSFRRRLDRRVPHQRRAGRPPGHGRGA